MSDEQRRIIAIELYRSSIRTLLGVLCRAGFGGIRTELIEQDAAELVLLVERKKDKETQQSIDRQKERIAQTDKQAEQDKYPTNHCPSLLEMKAIQLSPAADNVAFHIERDVSVLMMQIKNDTITRPIAYSILVEIADKLVALQNDFDDEAEADTDTGKWVGSDEDAETDGEEEPNDPEP